MPLHPAQKAIVLHALGLQVVKKGSKAMILGRSLKRAQRAIILHTLGVQGPKGHYFMLLDPR